MATSLIDPAYFKGVNESFGNHVGDQLLLIVSARSLGGIRAADTVVRVGGDEFVVVLSDICDDRVIGRVTASNVAKVSAPMQSSKHKTSVIRSIGISHYPEDGEERLLRLMNADSASNHS